MNSGKGVARDASSNIAKIISCSIQKVYRHSWKGERIYGLSSDENHSPHASAFTFSLTYIVLNCLVRTTQFFNRIKKKKDIVGNPSDPKFEENIPPVIRWAHSNFVYVAMQYLLLSLNFI